VPTGLCAVSRWREGCRNKGKAQLSSALDRISERITLAPNPVPPRTNKYGGQSSKKQQFTLYLNSKWRRECQSIPIDVQAVFHSSMWEPTVLATSQWPIRWWLIQSLAQPINFSRRSVIDVMKSHSAVSQGNVTRNKEARCAVIAGAREARFLRLVECVVPRSVALRLPSRGKGRSFMSARQFLFVLHDDVPSAQLDRSCDIHIRAGLSRPRFPCSRRQLAGL
jgi:hypothetical protein